MQAHHPKNVPFSEYKTVPNDHLKNIRFLIGYLYATTTAHSAYASQCVPAGWLGHYPLYSTWDLRFTVIQTNHPTNAASRIHMCMCIPESWSVSVQGLSQARQSRQFYGEDLFRNPGRLALGLWVEFAQEQKQNLMSHFFQLAGCLLWLIVRRRRHIFVWCVTSNIWWLQWVFTCKSLLSWIMSFA